METPTTPTNEGYRDNGDGEPHIPEPDYDLSDQDNDHNIYSNGDSNGSTATLRRRGRSVRSNTDTERKKKKTVSFIMNEELANIIHSSGTMTKRDSILKDPSRERDESKSRPAKRSPSKVTAPPLASDPVHTSPSMKATQHPAWQGGSIMASDPQQDSKLVSTSRIRIEVGNTGNNNGSVKLQKSQSFSAVLSPMSDEASAMNQSQSAAASSQTGISQEDLQKARSLLKSSRSFPELLEDGDNSSSGVSSDQDQDTIIVCEQVNSKQPDYVTKLTVSDKRSVGSSPRSDRSVTMTGPIGAVNIEWSGQEEEEQEHHYQNFASMMKNNYRSRTARSVHIINRQTFPTLHQS